MYTRGGWREQKKKLSIDFEGVLVNVEEVRFRQLNDNEVSSNSEIEKFKTCHIFRRKCRTSKGRV